MPGLTFKPCFRVWFNHVLDQFYNLLVGLTIFQTCFIIFQSGLTWFVLLFNWIFKRTFIWIFYIFWLDLINFKPGSTSWVNFSLVLLVFCRIKALLTWYSRIKAFFTWFKVVFSDFFKVILLNHIKKLLFCDCEMDLKLLL